jgi:sortase (surface protein transpeptidase)
MKILSLFVTIFLLSTSSAYAATMTAKVNKAVEFTEEGVHLKTNQGHVAIYAMNLTQKQFSNLEKIKKGDCIVITAKDEKIEKYDGVISINNFISAKKVSCKQ